MASRLKYFIELTKSLFYRNCRLVDLDATEQIAHFLFSVVIIAIVVKYFVRLKKWMAKAGHQILIYKVKH